ncbi:MAG: nitrate/nitrite transporter NrtS [Pseudomonadota bacterium]
MANLQDQAPASPMDHTFTELCGKGAFWRAAVEKEIVIRALKVAAIVGTILVLINQIDVLAAGQLPPIWKIVLTYCVPYSVSTYSAAAFKVAAAVCPDAE